jgi:hypothetical protein
VPFEHSSDRDAIRTAAFTSPEAEPRVHPKSSCTDEVVLRLDS